MVVRLDDWRMLGRCNGYLALPDGSQQKIEVDQWEASYPEASLPGNAIIALLGRVNAGQFLHFSPTTLRFVAVRKSYISPVVYQFEHLASGWTNCKYDDEYGQVVGRSLVRGFELLFSPAAN